MKTEYELTLFDRMCLPQITQDDLELSKSEEEEKRKRYSMYFERYEEVVLSKIRNQIIKNGEELMEGFTKVTDFDYDIINIERWFSVEYYNLRITILVKIKN